MVPIRLELKNFLSYGEDVPPLDFTGMHMVCLSGDNGHGKSALLDAITWALWGESRAGKNKHDDLVRIGSDEMSVQFTFELNGQIFRVLRKRSKRASGSQWELQQDNGQGGWRSLSGNTAGETEKAIQKLLRMSYDTFINSAYLRQGQADRFVQQPPGKRKEILADILDLSRYDQLEAKARERSRAAAAEATDLERDRNGMDAELAHEETHRQALAAAQARLEALAERRETLHDEWAALKQRKGELTSLQEHAETVRRQIAATETEIQGAQTEAREAEREAAQCRALLERRDAIARDYQTLLTARSDAARLEESVRQWNRGCQALSAAEKEWIAAENEVRRRLERAAAEHEDALGRLRDLPQLRAEYDALAARVAAADRMAAEQDQVKEEWEAASERFGDLKGQNNLLAEQIKEWESRLDALRAQQGRCQVCDAPLPPQKIAEIAAEYQATLAGLQAERQDVRAEAKTLKERTDAADARLKAMERQAKAAINDRVRFGQIEQRLLELTETEKTLPNLAAVRAEAERVLQAQDFAPEIAVKLTKIRERLKEYEHAEAEQEAVRARLEALADAERQHLSLEQAENALPGIEARLGRAQKTLAQRQENRAALLASLAGLTDVSGELARLETRQAEVKAAEAARQSEETAERTNLSRAQHHLDRCGELKAQRAELENKLLAARQEQEIYDQLAKAFGKKGVQALIIENAIPELQDEANRLLTRLTDGDMALSFETLREAKSKKDSPIETLDIKVSDNLGTRPLEMYSGGEGFRASFAIRIALSKLLARRAGARLQTLIIDEGFGTQDGKGREKLIEALNVISEDFERIIIISHIDELKDAFATRIEVVKTPSGSQFTILEGAAG